MCKNDTDNEHQYAQEKMLKLHHVALICALCYFTIGFNSLIVQIEAL